MNLISKYYEEYWSGKHGWRPPNVLYPDTVGVLKAWVPASSRILDLGCGDGKTYAQSLHTTARHYTGIDISMTALSDFRKLGLDSIFHDLSTQLPFEDQSFDVVICIEVLEHLFAPAIVVAEAARVLTPGGVLIIGIPNAAFFLDRLRLLAGRFEAGGSPTSVGRPWEDPHIRFFTERSAKKLLRTYNLATESVVGLDHPMLAALPIVSPFLAKFTGGYKRLSKIKTPLDHLARVYPRLFSRHLMIRARRTT